MKTTNSRIRQALALAGAIVCAAPLAAAAYVGPGAGLSALGSLLALIAAVLVAIAGFIWYPVKRLLRRRNPPVAGAEAGADTAAAQSRADSPPDNETR
jgi:hypothetical protein